MSKFLQVRTFTLCLISVVTCPEENLQGLLKMRKAREKDFLVDIKYKKTLPEDKISRYFVEQGEKISMKEFENFELNK